MNLSQKSARNTKGWSVERSRNPSRAPGAADKFKFKKLSQRLALGAVVLVSGMGHTEKQSAPRENRLSNISQNSQESSGTTLNAFFDLNNSLTKKTLLADRSSYQVNENSNISESLSSSSFELSKKEFLVEDHLVEKKDGLTSHVRNWLIEGGWPDELLERAEKVVFCESKNNPQVVNEINRKYHGLFQIEWNWFIYFGEDWESRYDPVVNARVAYKIYLYDREKGNPPWYQWDCKPR